MALRDEMFKEKSRLFGPTSVPDDDPEGILDRIVDEFELVAWRWLKSRYDKPIVEVGWWIFKVKKTWGELLIGVWKELFGDHSYLLTL